MNFKAIFALFDCAINHDLKYPRIRLQTAQGRPVVISRNGSKSRNPGHLTVTNGGKYGTPQNEYFGRIDPEGRFFEASFHTANIYPITEVLEKLAANPAEVAGELGRLTGNCVFCETRLNDPRSTAVGYGPICAGHFGLPWDAAKEAKKAAPAPLQTPNSRILANAKAMLADAVSGLAPRTTWEVEQIQGCIREHEALVAKEDDDRLTARDVLDGASKSNDLW